MTWLPPAWSTTGTSSPSTSDPAPGVHLFLPASRRRNHREFRGLELFRSRRHEAGLPGERLRVCRRSRRCPCQADGSVAGAPPAIILDSVHWAAWCPPVPRLVEVSGGHLFHRTNPDVLEIVRTTRPRGRSLILRYRGTASVQRGWRYCIRCSNHHTT